MKNLIKLIHHHLLVSVTLACFAGLLCHKLVHGQEIASYLLVFLLFQIAATTLLIKLRHGSSILCLPLFFTLGLYLSSTIYQPPDHRNHIYNIIHEKEDIALLATLCAVTPFDGHSARILLEPNGIRFKQDHVFKPVFGKTLLQLRRRVDQDLQPGDQVLVRAILAPPRKSRTPGGFSYSKYLAGKNIWMTGVIPSSAFIKKTSFAKNTFHKIKYFPENLRLKINRNISKHLDSPERGLYKALLIGDRTDINKETLEHFKGSGTMHLLAISGVHMSLLALLIFTSFSWLLRRSETIILHINIKKTAAFLTLLPLAGYTLLAGANSPVLRSLTMVLIGIFALLSDRIKSIAAIISAAALIMISFSPSALYSPSFQLTFAAVISISLITPLVVDLNKKSQKNTHKHSGSTRVMSWLTSAIIISLAATLGTAPLSLYHFNRISFVGPLANLFIEPLLCLFSLPVGFLALTLLSIVPDLANVLFTIGSLGLSAAVKVAQFFNTIPFSELRLPSPTVTVIFLYYTGLAGLMVFIKHQYIIPKLFFSFALTTSLYLIFSPFWTNPYSNSKFSTIHFLEVGHGSATLIQMPAGKTILVDGGSYGSPKFDIGERVIAPFLWKKGITQLDTVVITHPDSDHINGLSFIIEHFQPKIIWTNTLRAKDSQYLSLLNKAADLDIPVRVPEPSMTLTTSGAASLQEISNPTHRENLSCLNSSTCTSPVSDNETGIIVKYMHDELSVLFPGDIGNHVETQLINLNSPVQARILLSPHHGSKHSNSEDFIKTVSPEVVIVSTSKDPETSKAYKILETKCRENGVELLSTSVMGSMSIGSKKGEGLKITTMAPE